MKERLKPRKDGDQSRSKDMVKHIVDAATRVLEVTGYEKATTNRIAEKAGVSIGSFYQYFPNKDALFAQIAQYYMTTKTEELEKLLRENSSVDTPQLIHLLLAHLLESFHMNEKIARFLFRRLNQLDKTDLQMQLREEFARILAPELRQRDANLSAEKSGIKAQIVVNAVMGVIYSNLLSSDFSLQLPALQNELEQLIMGYLNSVSI